MEVAAAILGIILVALDIFTAIHAWKNIPVSKWIKVLSCIAILFLGWVAIIAYWLIYFLIIKKNNSTVQNGTTPTSHAPIDTTVNSFNPPEENNDEDEKTMRSLFNEAMNGPEGKKLSKSYEELMNIFIMKPNGECKGAGFSGMMDERDRAQRLAKTDSNSILPALGNHPEMYKAWWTVFYTDVFNRMQSSPNSQQIAMLKQIQCDVERGDKLLEISGALEYMQNRRIDDVTTLIENVTLTNKKGKAVNTFVTFESADSGKSLKIKTLDDTIKIKRQEKHGKIYYEIKGAYQYFYLGIGDDDLIRMAEILIAVPSILQFNLKDGVNKVWMEEYELPSLSKLITNN
jgi:hypothetical protein